MPINASIVTLPSRAAKGIAGAKRHIWLVTSGTSSPHETGIQAAMSTGVAAQRGDQAAHSDKRQQIFVRLAQDVNAWRLAPTSPW
jgi:hypothetical protein